MFLAACAQITVWTVPVPVTMQTFGVLVVGAIYGWRLGAATVAAYLVEGAIGLPFFAGMTGGLPILFGPTGGYLFGFVAAAAVVGWLAERGWDRNILTMALAMLIGNVVLYVPGLLWLSTFFGWEKAIEYGLAPFILIDAVKLCRGGDAVAGGLAIHAPRANRQTGGPLLAPQQDRRCRRGPQPQARKPHPPGKSAGRSGGA